MLTLILLLVLVAVLVGALPAWPHAREWGYGPARIILIVVVIVILLALIGVLPGPRWWQHP